MKEKQLMDWIMMLGLCAVDINLYLDTHPEDKEALAYCQECMELLDKAKRNYEANYGPLTAGSAVDGESYAWVETAMPWEVVR